MKLGSVVIVRPPNGSNIIYGKVIYLNNSYANIMMEDGRVRVLPRDFMAEVCGELKDKFNESVSEVIPYRPAIAD
jgi:hypothetical protein